MSELDTWMSLVFLIGAAIKLFINKPIPMQIQLIIANAVLCSFFASIDFQLTALSFAIALLVCARALWREIR